jgi:hypothetical protein
MAIREELIPLGENEYYQVHCVLSEDRGVSKWLAKVRVTRRDTGDYVKQGFSIFDADRSEVLEIAQRRAKTTLRKLARPSDWESAIRQILSSCNRLHSQIVGFSAYSIDALSSGDVDPYTAKYSEFWRKLIKNGLALAAKVEALTSEERSSLLTIPESAFVDPSDASSLSEIDSRLLVFEFFINPTERETEIHAAQKLRLAERFAELGWS